MSSTHDIAVQIVKDHIRSLHFSAVEDAALNINPHLSHEHIQEIHALAIRASVSIPEHWRAVASARITVKVDRLLGRETDPRIVKLSGLEENNE